jgi:hypothetical protein
VQIRQLLKPCAACGESLIFGHFAPDGDVLKLSEGWSRVCCPACQTLGPVRSGFRDACESWNALAPVVSDLGPPSQAASANCAAVDQLPCNPWRIRTGNLARAIGPSSTR